MMRETVGPGRARQAHLADLSDVALLKRLKKSKGWLHALCVRLFEEQGLAVVPGAAFQVRAVDATTVKEPGPSGSPWRLHYSGQGLPSRDVQLLRPADGNRAVPGRPHASENRWRSSRSAPGDHVIWRRPRLFDLRAPAFATWPTVGRAADCVVSIPGRVPLRTAGGRPFATCWPPCRRSRVRARSAPGRPWSRRRATTAGPACDVAGRVCVLRKSAEAIRPGAPENDRRDAARRRLCNQVRNGAATLRFAPRVRDPSSRPFPSRPFPPSDVLPSGIACAGRSNCSGQALQVAGASWGTCRSTPTTAPRRGSTASCSWRCWSRS